MAGYRDRLASGSYLVLVHAILDVSIPGAANAAEAYRRARYHLNPRSHADVLRLCAGDELVEPGLVGFGL